MPWRHPVKPSGHTRATLGSVTFVPITSMPGRVTDERARTSEAESGKGPSEGVPSTTRTALTGVRGNSIMVQEVQAIVDPRVPACNHPFQSELHTATLRLYNMYSIHGWIISSIVRHRAAPHGASMSKAGLGGGHGGWGSDDVRMHPSCASLSGVVATSPETLSI
jgi:hypothetical protein